jgi:type IV secretion system protein VirB6
VGSNTISTVLETNLINPIFLLWDSLYSWCAATIALVTWGDISGLMSILALAILVSLMYGVMTLAVAVFGVVALAMFLVANSVFILLMAFGPFFLLCLAFPFLQRFFETYIGNVMTAILAMAFTVLMVFFVANLFGLVGIQNAIPAANLDQFPNKVKSLVVIFASKAAMSLLIIYLYYKVFDLAAALGGGLNMGNNMVGGVRAIMRDIQRGGGAGISGSGAKNQISQGSSGSAGSGASGRAGRANATFTGAAGATTGAAISGTARGAIGAASVAAKGAAYLGRGAAAAGRYAYNRYSQQSNRIGAG